MGDKISVLQASSVLINVLNFLKVAEVKASEMLHDYGSIFLLTRSIPASIVAFKS